MNLTQGQLKLLIDVFNAGITRATESGIPIGKEYYQDIDEIKLKLYKELKESIKRQEEVNLGFNK